MRLGSPLLTTRQVAELLAVSPRTVTNWVKADRVPFVRLPGGEYRIPSEGLLDSLSGTHDLRPGVEGAAELDEGAKARRERDRALTMTERLEKVALLSKQTTAIAGPARRS